MMRTGMTVRGALLASLLGVAWIAGCDDGHSAIGNNDDLTAPEAVERTLSFAGYVYVDPGASDYTVRSAIQRQVRTAFGPLRIAKISVDDRELKDQVDQASLESADLDVVQRAEDGSTTVLKQVRRVSYTYRARALVTKASRESFSFALLVGNYQGFVQDILEDCVENLEHDREFASSFWYVWAPNVSSCKQLIQTEADDIVAARSGLQDNQISEQEVARRFLPVTAQLEAVEAPATTYPEYHRLFGLDDAAKQRVVVYQVMGVASHAGDPDSQRFANDMGFAEFLKTLKVLSDQWPSLSVSPDSSIDPLAIPFEDRTVQATVADLYKWIVDRRGYPDDIGSDQQQAFRRAIHDHLVRKWVRFQVPLTVTAGHTVKEMWLELRMLYGTSSSYSVRGYFKEAFKNGDVVLYNGHSYIGSGPLDPGNYSTSDLAGAGRYQLFFFNSCVSFNYYGVDYFGLKPGGSANLDLVSNGIEVYIRDGGKSMGQFIVALFDGTQPSWMEVLKRTQVTMPYWGLHDPNRAVDGEQDNVYQPDSIPLTVKEGWERRLEVELSSAACGAEASGDVALSASSPEAVRVEFLVNDQHVGSDAVAPYSTQWDSTALQDGPVTIVARAYDAAGQMAEDTCQSTVHNSQGDLFFDDMEGDEGKWQASGLWHRADGGSCASPAQVSGTHAWYFGDAQSCSYDTGSSVSGTLTSRAISGVTASSQLSFQSFREVESASSGSYDVTAVELSTDGGTSWNELWIKDAGDSSASAWTSSGPISLADYAGQTISIRFRFDSVDSYSNDHVGWMVDDVRITR